MKAIIQVTVTCTASVQDTDQGIRVHIDGDPIVTPNTIINQAFNKDGTEITKEQALIIHQLLAHTSLAVASQNTKCPEGLKEAADPEGTLKPATGVN